MGVLIPDDFATFCEARAEIVQDAESEQRQYTLGVIAALYERIDVLVMRRNELNLENDRLVVKVSNLEKHLGNVLTKNQSLVKSLDVLQQEVNDRKEDL